MCGIFGYVKENTVKGTLKSMGYSMNFRGPDHVGYHKYNSVNMGYVRLSIMDVNKGNQPFVSPDGSVVVFQNGEIYNYKDLQRELIIAGSTFTTQCDTEVLLNGYLQWGWEGLLSKIDGMFSISLLDKSSQKLYLARDRFGEKPLYYYSDGESFVYSSNLKSIKECDWINFSLCPISVQYYLFLHYVPWENSMFTNIYKLLPGHYIVYDLVSKNLNKVKYYTIPEIGTIIPDQNYLDNLLSTEFCGRSYADVPTGVFLSGGLDSSLLTHYLKQTNTELNTFSIGFEDSNSDESKYSSYVANYLKTNHHHFIFTQDLFTNLLDSLTKNLDEPLGDPAILPTYFLSLQAKKYVKVVLSGEGGDEIFGGYSYYNQAFKHKRDRFIFNNDLVTPSGFPLVTQPNIVKALHGHLDKSFIPNEQNFLDKVSSYAGSINKSLYADLATWLPDDLLVKLDRATMAASIEGRAPYLSRKVVEYGLSIKSEHKIDNVRSKKILQEVASKYLPEFIVYRPKHGFVLPMKSWLFNYLKDINIPRYLFELDMPLINAGVASILLVESRLNKIPDPRFTFSLVMLLKWYEGFMGV